MTQKELPFCAAERAADAIDAAEELPRVADGIKAHVHGFLLTVFWSGGERATFHAQELRDYVAKRTTCAPASPDRILRHARNSGWVGYEIVRPAKSLYRLRYVEPLSKWTEKPRREAEKCRGLIDYHERMADRYRARLAEIEEPE